MLAVDKEEVLPWNATILFLWPYLSVNLPFVYVNCSATQEHNSSGV